MSQYTFQDYAASLTAALHADMQADCDRGELTQEAVDAANFFEFEVMDLDAADLQDLMEAAFKAGQKSITT